MSLDAARRAASDLRDELIARGVKVSIELQEGRPTSVQPSRWYCRNHIASLGHHIVSKRSQGRTPFLWLIKAGRSDVPGPLANGYGGWDGVYRIITMGYANHPGRGGSLWTPSGTIPRNNGRPYLFGTEWEGGLDEDDWPAWYREFMGRSHAAVLAWLGKDERHHFEHSTWAPGRKHDRLGYTAASARRELRPYMTPSSGGDLEDDTMKIDNGQPARIAQRLVNAAHAHPRFGGFTSGKASFPLEVDGLVGPKTRAGVDAMRGAYNIGRDNKETDVLYPEDWLTLEMYGVTLHDHAA